MRLLLKFEMTIRNRSGRSSDTAHPIVGLAYVLKIHYVLRKHHAHNCKTQSAYT